MCYLVKLAVASAVSVIEVGIRLEEIQNLCIKDVLRKINHFTLIRGTTLCTCTCTYLKDVNYIHILQETKFIFGAKEPYNKKYVYINSSISKY